MSEKRHRGRGSASPELLVSVYGLKRGGHHAVVDWMRQGYGMSGRTTAHVNNAYQSHLGIQERAARDLPAHEIAAQGKDHDVLLVNYEDLSYTKRHEVGPYSQIRAHLPRTDELDVVVLRDYYNMVASRLQRLGEACRKGFQTTMDAIGWVAIQDIWLDMAQIPEGGSTPLFINYNQWFADNDYRKHIATDGLSLSAACAEPLMHIPVFGHGSSFDGVAFSGAAQQMNVLGRWRDMEPSLIPEYQMLIKDEKIAQLSADLFGIDYEQVKLETDRRYDAYRSGQFDGTQP